MAEREKVDIFVSVIAPTYYTSSVRAVSTLERNVKKVESEFDSKAIAATMFRHCTGPLARQVFHVPALQKAMNSTSVNAVHEMVKRDEENRMKEVSLSQQPLLRFL